MPAALSASRRSAASPPGGGQRPRACGRGRPAFRQSGAGRSLRRGAARPGKEGGREGGSCHVLCGERSAARASAPRAAERGSCRRPPRAARLSLRRTRLRVRARGAAAVPGWGERLRGEPRRWRGSVRADFLRAAAPGAAGGAPRGGSAKFARGGARAARWGESGRGTGRGGTGRCAAVQPGLSRSPCGDPRGEQLLESPAASLIAVVLLGLSVPRPRVLLRVGDEREPRLCSLLGGRGSSEKLLKVTRVGGSRDNPF